MHISLKAVRNALSCSNNPLFAGIGSIITQAISCAYSSKHCFNASKSFKGKTSVSPAKLSGTPAEVDSPKVTKPEPAFTRREST